MEAAQFAANLLANIAGLVLSLASGFLLAPFLIAKLGVAAYGLVPLVYSIVNYLSVANIALNSATARYVIVAATKGDRQEAGRVFATSFWGSLAVACTLLAIGAVASIWAPTLIRVPAGYELDARILFVAGALNVALVIISSPLSIGLYYTNRLDYKGLIDLSNRVAYIAGVLLLVTFVTPRPAMVGIAVLFGTAVGLSQSAVALRRFMPWLSARSGFSLAAFSHLIRFGAWSVVAHAGNMLLLTFDLIVVNRVSGPLIGGAYAAVTQWPSVVRTFASIVASIFAQPMAHVYAKDGKEALHRYAQRATRLTAVLVLIPVVAICGSAESLLRLWLGDFIASYWFLLILLTFHLASNAATIPLVSALQTLVKIRTLGIATCVAGIVNVALALVLVKATGLGVYAVALAGAAGFTALASLFVPLYVAAEFGRPSICCLFTGAKSLILTTGAAACGRLLESRAPTTDWGQLLARAMLLALAAAAAGFFVLLTPHDRATTSRVARGHWDKLVARAIR